MIENRGNNAIILPFFFHPETNETCNISMLHVRYFEIACLMIASNSRFSTNFIMWYPCIVILRKDNK